MTQVTVTEIERYGHTSYEVRRAGSSSTFSLTLSDVVSAAGLDAVVAIAEALPEGYDVRFIAARSNVMGAVDKWEIFGHGLSTTVTSIEKIVPAAIAHQSRPVIEAPAAVKTPQVRPAARPSTGWSNASRRQAGRPTVRFESAPCYSCGVIERDHSC